jgi:ribosomal protein S18 acetylase RimI-like enzyme
MSYKLKSQTRETIYEFEMIDIDDMAELAILMLDSIKGTCEYVGETLDDIVEEIGSVINGSFAPFIYETSYIIKQNEEIVSAIMISFYEGYPLISEIFTKKQYHNLGMARALIKNSINSLLKMGYKDLILNVDPRNTAAINLYNKVGFKEVW